MRWVCGPPSVAGGKHRQSPEVEIHACLLDDLTDHGPFAPIFRTVTDPNQPADWLGNTFDGSDDD